MCEGRGRGGERDGRSFYYTYRVVPRCVCLLLQDLVQSCLHGGEGGVWEDMCYERRRAEACVVCVFITAVPNTKLCAWGEEDSGGHVL
jgi:hypothetical protein